MTHNRHSSNRGHAKVIAYMSFSLIEKVVFLLALAAAATGFWLRFRRVVVKIETAKPDADFKLAPIGKRVWDFFWEVICQAKVTFAWQITSQKKSQTRFPMGANLKSASGFAVSIFTTTRRNRSQNPVAAAASASRKTTFSMSEKDM